MKEPQSAPAVMMVRPLRFTANPLTALSNAFQEEDAPAPEKLLDTAHAEFDQLAEKLAAAGVRVCVFEDIAEPETPDAVFPNNWITTHVDGTVAVYPMLAANRRTERRPEFIERLASEHGFRVNTVVDFSRWERYGRILEGTGSMILDRVNRIAYACRSARTDAEVLDDFCRRFGYRPMLFDAVDRNGQAIYHTNVMMALGGSFAVICLASIRDPEERQAVVASLQATGHEIVEIDFTQLENFAGNMLELRAGERSILAMSQRAHESLDAGQLAALRCHADLVSSPINTLEDYGGGSVRCMLAELYLPLETGDDD